MEGEIVAESKELQDHLGEDLQSIFSLQLRCSEWYLLVTRRANSLDILCDKICPQLLLLLWQHSIDPQRFKAPSRITPPLSR